MFFRTVLWQACVQYFDTGRAWLPPPNNEKSKNIVKIVNHLVAIAKVIDLQRLSFLFYKKNHLVIVLMVLLCSMLICETPSHKSEKQDKIYAYRQD